MQVNANVGDGQHGIAELKNKTCRIAGKSNGEQADRCSETTKGIAQCVGRICGREMKKLVMAGKETVRAEPPYP